MQSDISAVLPYYNEADCIASTLEHLFAQSEVSLHLILVDNGSSDDSARIVADICRCKDASLYTLLEEDQPGQVMALHTGLAAVKTPFVAICDADTRYPPTYMKTALELLERHGAVGAFAYNAKATQTALRRWLWGNWRARIVPGLLRGQCHAGGYGHVFRTDVLEAAGGYSKQLWPYVLKDHELAHRVLKRGRIVYNPSFYCYPDTDRRADRRDVRWTLFERIVYHATPFALKDWFFYRFLARRFAARKMDDVKLRVQAWKANEERE